MLVTYLAGESALVVDKLDDEEVESQLLHKKSARKSLNLSLEV